MNYLCVKYKDLDTRLCMQKKVNLGDLLFKSRYYSSIEEAKESGYLPLEFATSVRSVNTNLVARLKEEDCYEYYQIQVGTPIFPCVGEDLIAYQSSLNVMRYFHSSLAFSELMMNYTAHQIIGLYNPGPAICNPTILSHVIIQDVAVNTFKAHFKDNAEWYPIENTLNIHPYGNFQTFLDQLIILKGGKPYAKHDNN